MPGGVRACFPQSDSCLSQERPQRPETEDKPRVGRGRGQLATLRQKAGPGAATGARDQVRSTCNPISGTGRGRGRNAVILASYLRWWAPIGVPLSTTATTRDTSEIGSARSRAQILATCSARVSISRDPHVISAATAPCHEASCRPSPCILGSLYMEEVDYPAGSQSQPFMTSS